MRSVVLIIVFMLAVVPGVGADLLENESFQISYHPDDRATAEASIEILKTARDEFASCLPLGDDPIYVVIAHDLREFSHYAASFGSLKIEGLARPSSGLIVVKGPSLRTAEDDYRGTLRHELVHILLYRNVDTRLLPKWLNEGLCMSLANEYRWASLFKITDMFVGNRIIQYRNLDQTFLSPGNEMEFGDAYAQGLSMTRYLRDKLGDDVFWSVVLNTKHGKTFGESLEIFAGISETEFWTNYQRSLWWIALIGSLATGSVFAPISLLVVIGWLRKRRLNKRILDQWAVDEEHNVYCDYADWEDAEDFWEEVIEDPDIWDDGKRF